MKKQYLVFLGIFLFLAIGIHFKEWVLASHMVVALSYGANILYFAPFAILGYILFIGYRCRLSCKENGSLIV